jgi:hypothetical protein
MSEAIGSKKWDSVVTASFSRRGGTLIGFDLLLLISDVYSWAVALFVKLLNLLVGSYML